MAKKGTYGGDPANNTLDAIRLEVGDTDCENFLLSDAEIEHFQAQGGNTLLAASRAAYALQAFYAQQIDCTAGRARQLNSQRFKHYGDLGKRLAARGNRLVAPYAGGLSEAEKSEDRRDTDLVQPEIRKEMHDNPRKGDAQGADDFIRRFGGG